MHYGYIRSRPTLFHYLSKISSLSSLTLRSPLLNQRTHLPLCSSSLVKVSDSNFTCLPFSLLHFNAHVRHTMTANNFLKLGWTNDPAVRVTGTASDTPVCLIWFVREACASPSFIPFNSGAFTAPRWRSEYFTGP